MASDEYYQNQALLSIREASHLDAPSLLLLDEAALGPEPDGPWKDDMRLPETYAKLGGIFLVGEKEGQIIAMGALRRVAETRGEIKRVRVHPTAQRQGIARLLMQTLEAKAQDLGYTTLLVRTDVALEAAQQLYLHCGYQEIQRDEKDVHFIKTLNNASARYSNVPGRGVALFERKGRLSTPAWRERWPSLFRAGR